MAYPADEARRSTKRPDLPCDYYAKALNNMASSSSPFVRYLSAAMGVCIFVYVLGDNNWRSFV